MIIEMTREVRDVREVVRFEDDNIITSPQRMGFIEKVMEVTAPIADKQVTHLKDFGGQGIAVSQTVPESGQFVALWTFKGKLCSALLKREGGEIGEYIPHHAEGCGDFWEPWGVPEVTVLYVTNHSDGESNENRS